VASADPLGRDGPPPRWEAYAGHDDIEAFLERIDHDLQPHLQRAIDRVPAVDTLKEGVTFQVLGGGKRIRAALCALVCEMFAGAYEPALGFAATLEHLQNLTLVHDDIADGDVERRGKVSVWKRFGLAHGINIGDAFIPLSALGILEAALPAQTKLQLFQMLSELGLEIAEGQSRDIDLRSNDAPTEADYVTCTRKKTGGFFAMATVGGGIIAGATQPQRASLRAFAAHAGVAFQIKDDVLDVIGGKGRTVGSDVLEGKRTLLVVYALGQASADDRDELLAILNRPRAHTTPAEVEWALDLYRRTRARARAELTAERCMDEAMKRLDDFPETAAKYRFLRLAKYLTKRVR
jgi:geranylgeranyl diphosphate synthase, type I